MAKTPSVTELGQDLLAAIQSNPADAAALDAMVRGRARLYAAATEALTAIHAIAMKPTEPGVVPAAPAIETVQRHVEKIAGTRLPDAEPLMAAQIMVPGPGALYVVVGILIAVTGPICAAVTLTSSGSTTPSSEGSAFLIMLTGVLTTIATGTALIAFGFWSRRARATPSLRSRADLHTLVRAALDSGRSLGARVPRGGPNTMLQHISEGMAYWMVHSVALERAAAGDRMHQDAWNAWHRFAAQLAMVVWVVATAAGEQVPLIALAELVQGPFNKESLDRGRLYVILGAFDASKEALLYNREALRADTVPLVVGTGLVALAGGLAGIRGLLANGELALRQAATS